MVTDPDAATRRQSGRVSRAPRKYSPDELAPGGKRKRGSDAGDAHDEEDSDVDDDDESSDDDAESSEPDEEELKERKRRVGGARKSRAAKKLKTDVNGRSKQSGRRKARKSGAGDSTSVLYDQIFEEGKDPRSVATEWLNDYEKNKVSAMTEFVNFVLASTGCSLTVTGDDIQDEDNIPNRLTDLQDTYQSQQITEYPLIAKGRTTPPFRSTLVNFISAIVKTAHDTSLLHNDSSLLENIETWVTSMSSSSVRPFRHTATVISLATATALCGVARDISTKSAKTRKQADGESGKGRVNRGRVSELRRKVDEWTTRQEQIEAKIQDIDKTVFVHRYRDVDPKVRIECVQSLASWMTILPDVFLTNKHVRHLGWLLSDSAASVRLEVLKQLLKLYKNKDNIPPLRLFTEHYRKRMVEIAERDADSAVRAVGIEVLDEIREAGLLEPSDVDTIGLLLFDSEPKVRKAVVNFFVENINDLYSLKVDDIGGEETLENLNSHDDEDFDGPRVAWLKYKCLAEAFKAYDNEGSNRRGDESERPPANAAVLGAGLDSRYSLAAQALYPLLPELEEWEILAGYLLFDHSFAESRSLGDSPEAQIAGQCKLDAKEEIILLEILYASVKQKLLSEDAEPQQRRKGGKAAQLTPQEKIARHLAIVIPRLLTKYGGVPEAVSAVLRLEHVMNLEVFQELRQDTTTYSSLLDNINQQFLTHVDEAVLAEASAAILHGRSVEGLEEVTDGKLQTLWTETLSPLAQLTKGITISAGENVGDSRLMNLANTVRRIVNLASISNCTILFEKPILTGGRKSSQGNPPITTLLQLASLGIHTQFELDDDEDLVASVVSDSLQALLFYFIWHVRDISNAPASITDAQLKNVLTQRVALLKVIGNILKTRSRFRVDKIRIAAAGTLLDLTTAFATLRQPLQSKSLLAKSKGKARSDANLAEFAAKLTSSLIVDVPTQLQSLLLGVYVSLEKAYAKKGRKNLEVHEDLDAAPESESESEDDGDETKKERQQAAVLLEQYLCEFAGKIVLALLAGLLKEPKGHAEVTGDTPTVNFRARLEQHRAKLGPNFKAVVAHLDELGDRKAKKPAAGKTLVVSRQKGSSKSKAVVSDDEESDEEEEAPEHDEVEMEELEVDNDEPEDIEMQGD